jgi:serine/threonine protein kinase
VDAISQLNVGLGGRYRVEREIGAGGMATVFLARYLRHDRRGALKVLKPELAALLGAERFLSEIRVTANLQHPNLLPLFDSGESDGWLFYVMPYVEGDSLRQRLDSEKQLRVEEVVRLAVAICGALDYAHRHGVIHRDLKPENVLLHDGQPLVADFGIALAISNAAGARLTQTGISLGTPQYMSPEQATAERSIDARADIYSVGALIYEMLSGEPPHTGPSSQAIIAKLLTEDPRPVSSLRRSVPADLAAAVHRALEKLPADRFATARELADALSGKIAVASPRRNAESRSLSRWKLTALALGAVSVTSVAWALTHRTSAAPTQQMRFPLGLPDSAAVSVGTFYRSLDLSPDGTKLAYVGESGLFIRPLNELTPRRLTSEPARDPRFSPDGAWVGYISNDVLRKVPVDGGPPTTIVDSVGRFGWGPDGRIVYTRSGPAVADLWLVSENGRQVRPFVHRLRPNDAAYGSPTFLPDGDTFLVPVATSGSSGPREIAAYRFSTGKMSYLGAPGDHPLYLPGGLLLY